MNVEAVGGRIRAARERVGMTQLQAADRAGIHVDTLRGLEQGTAVGVKVATLSGIAAALDVPVGVLLGERPPPLHWPVDGVFWRQVRREVEQIREVA